MENQTLEIDPEGPGLVYTYQVCVERFLMLCTKHRMDQQRYDLRDSTVRQRLIAMGFVARAREKR